MKGDNGRFYIKNEKIINIIYFWHIEISSGYNICLIQEFYDIDVQSVAAS